MPKLCTRAPKNLAIRHCELRWRNNYYRKKDNSRSNPFGDSNLDSRSSDWVSISNGELWALKLIWSSWLNIRIILDPFDIIIVILWLRGHQLVLGYILQIVENFKSRKRLICVAWRWIELTTWFVPSGRRSHIPTRPQCQSCPSYSHMGHWRVVLTAFFFSISIVGSRFQFMVWDLNLLILAGWLDQEFEIRLFVATIETLMRDGGCGKYTAEV